MILYVQHSEETSFLKIVHFHEGVVPSEMEANAKSMSLCVSKTHEAKVHGALYSPG